MTQEQIWLIIGFIGQTIFASRFLIQWVVSERASKSIIYISEFSKSEYNKYIGKPIIIKTNQANIVKRNTDIKY